MSSAISTLSNESCLDGDTICWEASCLTVTVKWKLAPFPSWLSTQISPPINVTNCLHIAKPRPVPPYRRDIDSSPWLNGWNSNAFCVLFSPIPVSLTSNSSWMSSTLCVHLTLTEISPSSVNLRALLTKLLRICCMRNGSPMRFNGTSRDICWISSMCFSSARPKCSLMVWFTSASKLNCVDSISSLPASIFEKSSMSLIILSRVCDAPSIWIRFVCWSLSSAARCESLVRPIMALSGVRISWLMRARKSDFAFVAFWRSWVSASSALRCWRVLSHRPTTKPNERITKPMKYSWNVFCFFCIRLRCSFNWLSFSRSLMVSSFSEIESRTRLRANNLDCCSLKLSS